MSVGVGVGSKRAAADTDTDTDTDLVIICAAKSQRAKEDISQIQCHPLQFFSSRKTVEDG